MARCHCPDSEIAACFGVGENTIKLHFGPLIKEQREIGKKNLRAKQYRLAMKGDRTMLIWLGKQLLKQRDMTHNEFHVQIDPKKSIEELLRENRDLVLQIEEEQKIENAKLALPNPQSTEG
jgi:hypothetical protein